MILTLRPGSDRTIFVRCLAILEEVPETALHMGESEQMFMEWSPSRGVVTYFGGG